uniref:Uncharacterized protein n=1 Tax=Cannabis sativa TaxID=3483 RepID=A0A803QR22_CANSA
MRTSSLNAIGFKRKRSVGRSSGSWIYTLATPCYFGRLWEDVLLSKLSLPSFINMTDCVACGLLTGNQHFNSFESLFLWLSSFADPNMLRYVACMIEGIWQCRNEFTFRNIAPDSAATSCRIHKRFEEFYSDVVATQHCERPDVYCGQGQFEACFMVDASVVDHSAGLARSRVGGYSSCFGGGY